ncbi:restriction endonuclease subunit S [Nocardiopsis sp. YSL2]|uniref:restriction endonuclease subunit S n=1 Tax=Nocardiopsis sp. YSL2 TaxID=2939492 RepID=UPI0026F453CC|nr:restriction endonuclease subunit S [Nocardiopsis sp. YSL2]
MEEMGLGRVTGVPLEEVAEVKPGPSGALLKELGDRQDGIPVITPSDFTGDRRIDGRHVRRIPETDALKKRATAFELRAGDIVMVRQGALGRLAITGSEHTGWIYGSSCVRIRAEASKVLPGYLAVYLARPEVLERLQGPALSGTVPSFNAEAVRRLAVEVPVIDRQRTIVDTLAEMDAVIATRRAVTERLESLKPSVFAALLEEEGTL